MPLPYPLMAGSFQWGLMITANSDWVIEVTEKFQGRSDFWLRNVLVMWYVGQGIALPCQSGGKSIAGGIQGSDNAGKERRAYSPPLVK